MSIDHISIAASDFQKTVSFYEAVLSTLGYKKLMTIEDDKAVGFGNRFPSFWIHRARTSNETSPRSGTHIAFVASSRQKIDEFYRIALKHGAKDNGPPGFRPQYHRFYYAAFVIDADGNNIEAVNHFDWKSFIGWKTMIFTFTILLIFISVLIKMLF
jgi:catechol 2,3-dioxygenase-like lactoylglutathione lyase family enzyme